ncbi:MAG: hypothetical protein IPQ19_14310 [Bacteroidetes bacterium]|nr:hypothetical protein [Bacteroidota bacterium]
MFKHLLAPSLATLPKEMFLHFIEDWAEWGSYYNGFCLFKLPTLFKAFT